MKQQIETGRTDPCVTHESRWHQEVGSPPSCRAWSSFAGKRTSHGSPTCGTQTSNKKKKALLDPTKTGQPPLQIVTAWSREADIMRERSNQKENPTTMPTIDEAVVAGGCAGGSSSPSRWREEHASESMKTPPGVRTDPRRLKEASEQRSRRVEVQ
jgi:hypothetical protein